MSLWLGRTSSSLVLVAEPALDGLQVSRNKIWSSNTGRSANAEMVGTLIGTKYKLTIKWNCLNASQVATIDSIVSENAFFYCKFLDPNTNAYKTIRVYAGDASYPVHTYAVNTKYTNVAIDLIEK